MFARRMVHVKRSPGLPQGERSIQVGRGAAAGRAVSGGKRGLAAVLLESGGTGSPALVTRHPCTESQMSPLSILEFPNDAPQAPMTNDLFTLSPRSPPTPAMRRRA